MAWLQSRSPTPMSPKAPPQLPPPTPALLLALALEALTAASPAPPAPPAPLAPPALAELAIAPPAPPAAPVLATALLALEAPPALAELAIAPPAPPAAPVLATALLALEALEVLDIPPPPPPLPALEALEPLLTAPPAPAAAVVVVVPPSTVEGSQAMRGSPKGRIQRNRRSSAMALSGRREDLSSTKQPWPRPGRAARAAWPSASCRPSLMMSARHEDGGAMSDAELRDELMTLLFAGHETTAIALACVFYWLHRDPDELGRVHAEIDTLGPSADVEAGRGLGRRAGEPALAAERRRGRVTAS